MFPRSTPPPSASPVLVGPGLLAMLSVLAVVGPVSMDLYLPTLPEVAAELRLSGAQESWSLLGCLSGLAIGQVAWGPVTDRLGRRRAVLTGLCGWTLVTIGCAITPDPTLFLVLRILQGLAGAAGLTVSRAVLADLLPPDQLRRPLARLMILTSVFTVLSPVLGGLLLTVMPWRGIFWLLGIAGILITGAAAVLVPESRGRSTAAEEPSRPGPGFALATLTAGLAFATIVIYVTASPEVLRGRYGLDGLEFGLLFAVTAVAMAGGAQLSPSLAARLGVARTAVGALTLSLALCLLLALLGGLASSGRPPLAAVVVLLVAANAATGAAMPLAAAEAMAAGGGRLGTASGLVGGLQFGLGALVSVLLTPWHPDTVTAMAVAMTGSAAATATAWVAWTGRTRSTRAGEEVFPQCEISAEV